MNEEFTMSFDVPTTTKDKHYEFANVLSKPEQAAYNEAINSTKLSSEVYNPFKNEVMVTLKSANSKRYSYIVQLKDESVAKVSAVLGKNYVNISYWDTFPNVIKNVPVSDLVIYSKQSFKVKLRYYFVKLIRKILFIK